MSTAAILFLLGSALLLAALGDSYAFKGDLIQDAPSLVPVEFDSGIMKIDPAFFSDNDLKRYLVFGKAQGPDLPYSAGSGGGFFGVAVLSKDAASGMSKNGYTLLEDYKLDFYSETAEASGTPQITRSAEAQSRYGVDGNGTVIAVMDTGVDFSNPDIRHSLARDENNHPIMLDPDGQGIILTNATFYAFIDENGIVLNNDGPLPPDIHSSVYVTEKGVFLDVSRGGKNTNLQVYNSFYPEIGISAVFEGLLDHDMKIGDNNRDYIKSKSGVYHLGVMYQGDTSGRFSGIQTVPVLVVDSFQPGVYDTIIPDLSTAWMDYTRLQLSPGQVPAYDFDFTDEKPIVLGSGKEFLVYDSDGDGRNDFSAGAVGARVLDVYGTIADSASELDDSLKAVNGTLLPAMDPDGEFFGVMTDFDGHGTSSTGTIASRGQEKYGIYDKETQYVISGVAPGASIIPVKALWFGDIMYGWMWSAGFDLQGGSWKYSGARADIISNSWGISQFPPLGVSPGFDSLSLIHGALATPRAFDDDYPGVLMVTSAGNSGHGYGTIGPPAASPFGITVGATTNNVFVGFGGYEGEPRFGSGTEHRNHVVDFTSRGPSPIGDPKPDLMSVGAFGFVPTSVLKKDVNSEAEPFEMYGGTSMAAPAVAGTAAVLMEGMQRQSHDVDPFTVKNILMSTARDLRNDPFTQGSGLADAAAALDYVYGKNGTFLVHNDASYKNLADLLEPAVEAANLAELGLGGTLLPSGSIPMTSWFAGWLLPGEKSSAVFTITNPSDSPVTVSVEPRSVSLVQKTEFDGTTEPRQLDPASDKTDVFAPNYVGLSDVKRHATLGDFFDDEDPIPEDSSLLILGVNYAFEDFMNATSDRYADDLKIASLYLYDWLDENNDTKIASDELALVSRAGSWGTVQELRISDPADKFEGTPIVGVYPVPTRYSYWTSNTEMNSTAMEYTLSASYYQDERWPVIWTESQSVTVPAGGSADVDVTLVAPDDAQTGIYQGFLAFEGPGHTAKAPVSFVVRQPVVKTDTLVKVAGIQSDDIMYGNGYVKGAFDMTNRYMAGDWRQYYFDIQDGSIDTVAIELFWDQDDTSHSIFVTDPAGKIIQTSVPAGVFGHFDGWPSLDWLGISGFSEGGGFFPAENKDERSTVLYVPVNQTGTYTLLTHSTLFAGDSTTEPVTLVAKFTNLSPPDGKAEQTLDAEQTRDAEPAAAPAPGYAPGIAESPVKSDNAPTVLGVVIGLFVGVAVGVLFMSLGRRARRVTEQDL
ncbi:MAG: peptidase S8 [Nitrosopumilus sp. H13]|nr:MAG: peptidase S8 [Nitrosopumilus sp. H13]